MSDEFDRQLKNLLRRGYPGLAQLGEEEFVSRIEPLRHEAVRVEGKYDGNGVPFVIALSRELVGSHGAVTRVERRGKPVLSVLDPRDLAHFDPIDGLTLPARSTYLVVDVDTGSDTRNVTPDDALQRIEAGHRSPLTIDEGIALITHYPDAVARNAGFSLLGSRCGDRRVTAVWISQGRPKLGWCWAGNPHTWLGSASCGRRWAEQS